MNTNVITRIAPSPTGHLHIGTARTALFNFLYARHNGGKLIFRSEDTDRERSTKEFEEGIIEGLKWLGIEWDNREIYRQSECKDIYKKYLLKAIESGEAYISKEESKKKPGEMIEVVRLKNPNKSVTFIDEVRGEITFDTTELGDFVIARSIEDALYHFAVVVDDFEMGITHVIRGEDHIPNTPRQILIQEAIGATRPIYAHLPLILAPDRSKLSKRHGAVSLSEYKEDGFLPEAVVNYLALLGWSSGTDKEIFTMDELIQTFDLSGVQKGGAIFDREKMLWINKEHLKQLDDKTYMNLVKNVLPESIFSLPQYSEERLKKLLPVIRERARITGEIKHAGESGEYDFVFAAPKIDLKLLKWKKDREVGDVLPRLKKAIELLSQADFKTPESIKTILWEYAETVGKGELLWPLRFALTGLERSPDPFTCAFILGKDETISRINSACDKIKG